MEKHSKHNEYHLEFRGANKYSDSSKDTVNYE